MSKTTTMDITDALIHYTRVYMRRGELIDQFDKLEKDTTDYSPEKFMAHYGATSLTSPEDLLKKVKSGDMGIEHIDRMRWVAVHANAFLHCEISRITTPNKRKVKE